MKKTFLLFPLIVAGGYLMLTSYASGPAANGQGNRTGSTGSSTVGCSTSGCHAANSSATSVQIALLDANSQTVTTYTPGTKYTVKITGTNSNSLSHFGFQASATLSSKAQAGTFAIPTGSTSKMHTRANTNPGNVTIVEHSTAIAGTSGSYEALFDWTAPAAGSGTVTFYAVLNAVNHDNTISGDAPNMATPLAITEAVTGIASVANTTIDVKAYPNPVSDVLNIGMDKVQAGAYTMNIFDLSGKQVYSNNLNINSNSYNATINTREWKAGMYSVQIAAEGVQRTIAVVKY